MAWLRSTACIPVVTMKRDAGAVHVAWDAIPDAQEYVINLERPDRLVQTLLVFAAAVLLFGEGRFRILPVFASGAEGQWSDWFALSERITPMESVTADAPAAQLHLYNVNVYSCRQELITYLYCAHFVTAETWQSLDMLGFDPIPIAQSVVFAGPFAVNDGHNPHPLTGAVAWLSAFSNLPQRRYAIGAAAQLFAGASVADLESYVTLWQGTIYDARVIP